MLSRRRLKKPRRSESPSSAIAGAPAPVSKSSCQVRAIDPRRIGTLARLRGRPCLRAADYSAGRPAPLPGRADPARARDDRLVAAAVARHAGRLARLVAAAGVGRARHAVVLDTLAARS